MVETDLVTLDQSLEQNAQTYSAVQAGVPAITSFSPTSGVVGTLVNVYGSNFIGVSQLEIDGVNVPSFSIINEGLIRFNVPTNATTGILRLTKGESFGRSNVEFSVTV